MIRKRFILCFMAIVFAGVMTSCEDLVGKQTPIKLDNSELTFTSVGGEQAVTAVNYNSWWISGAYESKQSVNGVSMSINYIYPTSTDGEDAYTYDILDGGWYYVVVPEKGESNKAIITVCKNDTSRPRSATITMQNQNAFVNINIQQE